LQSNPRSGSNTSIEIEPVLDGDPNNCWSRHRNYVYTYIQQHTYLTIHTVSYT